MKPAASDSGASHQVAQKLKEFQTKAAQGKREHERERQQEREQECKREQERQRQQISEEHSKKESVEESNNFFCEEINRVIEEIKSGIRTSFACDSSRCGQDVQADTLQNLYLA